MIDQNSYSEAVADELGLASSAYAEDVTAEVSLTSSAYGEDVDEAINNRPVGDYDLRVLQYNIGHFNMGRAAAPTGNNPNTNNVLINSNKSDGYPNSVDRNYAIQLQRWKDCINGVGADIIGIEEYNKYFGWNGGSVVELADTGIFLGYDISVGRMGLSLVNGGEVTHGWQWNALASKYAIYASGDEELGSTGNNVAKCYARYATVDIKGRQVIIASTHLNWAQNNDAVTSRALEIQHLINWLKDYPYVILMGDFNVDGAYKSNKTDQDYLDGAAQGFDPFIDAGFTLANHGRWGDLKTAFATGSRPDQTKSYPYTYIDNIIVKGFAMSNVQVIDDGRLTDHCAVYCDLTLIEEGGTS